MDGAAESAWMVSGEDSVEEMVESGLCINEPNPALLFDRNAEGDLENCFVMNLGCEWDRRRVLDEK